MIEELEFVKPLEFWRNPKPIPLLQPHNLIEISEQPEPIESTSTEETGEGMNELTHFVIVEGARQGMPINWEIFAAITNH